MRFEVLHRVVQRVLRLPDRSAGRNSVSRLQEHMALPEESALGPGHQLTLDSERVIDAL